MDNGTNKILEKKLDRYESKLVDFKACPEELTVEITLNEYRQLVSNNAANDYEKSKLREEILTKDREIDKLKKVVDKLHEEIIDATADDDGDGDDEMEEDD
jgi:hypothetical protein